MKNLRIAAATVGLSVLGLSAWAQNLFLVESPSNIAGSYNFTDSYTADGWGANLDTTHVTAEAAWAYDDGTYVDPTNGAAGDSACCGPIINTGDINGKVAFLYRGTCNFSLKAYRAQAAGAVGCVIVNNVPGNLINMLSGDSASAITIPVIFISDANGAALADSINAGGVQVFIGNPNGVFANNIGAYSGDFGMANSQSIPSTFVSNTGYEVPIGAWIFNFGSADAINAVLSATIDRDGTQVYDESSVGATISPGDSLFVSLPNYSETTYEEGFYTITYNMVSDATDDLPSDNVNTASFWINGNGVYSKSRVDPNDGPQGSGGLRPATGTEFEWCVALQSPNASSMQITGMTFNTSTNNIDLTTQSVQLAVYEWNDPFDGTAAATFNDLTELTNNEFYDYAADLQGEFVTHTFAQPIDLIDEQKYLGCATIFIDNMFLGVDGSLDYNTTYDGYPTELFFPLNDIDGGTWYAGGFGTDNVPAIILNMQLANGIADEVKASDVKPYPNPTKEMINIPLGVAMNGNVTVTVFDMEGRMVLSENLCQNNSTNIRMDVSQLASGMHTFKLQFEDNSTTTFRVVIAK